MREELAKYIQQSYNIAFTKRWKEDSLRVCQWCMMYILEKFYMQEQF